MNASGKLFFALISSFCWFSASAAPFDDADQKLLMNTGNDYLQAREKSAPLGETRGPQNLLGTLVRQEPAAAPDIAEAQRKALSDQQTAFLHYDDECKNRIAAYESQGAAQAKRDEKITIWGLIFGFAGTLSTVTNVARGLSGLAGLAPSITKTFSDSGDSARATHAVLASLNQKIIDDSKKYFDLPNPMPGNADFDKDFYNKQNAVMTLFVDCRAYYAANITATASK